jgi:tight adherence protein C
MPAYVYLGAALVSGAVILLVVSIHSAGAPSAQLVRSNLSNAPGRLTDLRQVILSQPTRERVVRPAAAGLAQVARRITPAGFVDTLERRVNLAGVSESWPIERVLAAKAVLGATCALVGTVVFVSNPSGLSVLFAVAATVIGFLVPDVLLSSRARERQEDIQRALPDVLDQVTICVEAGLGFEAAMMRASTSGTGPLAIELGRTLQDISLGMPRRAALEQLLARTDVGDLRHFVIAVRQAERHGVAIAQVLRIQSNELREKRRQRAEERALKIPVKIVFPLILCILPALFIVLMGPAAIRISNSGFGG